MGFEAYNKPEERYKADVIRLNDIAEKVSHGDYGRFQKALAEAWILADSFDKRILKPSFEAIVVKYGLEEEKDDFDSEKRGLT